MINALLKTKKYFFLMLIIGSIFVFGASYYNAAAICEGRVWCESCCPTGMNRDTGTKTCCFRDYNDPNDTCTGISCIEASSTPCISINNNSCQGQAYETCNAGAITHNECGIKNPYTCNVCYGLTCSPKDYLTPCSDSCSIVDVNSCTNACTVTATKTCGNGVSCTCTNCQADPACTTTPTCQGPCCTPYTCIGPGSAEAAACGFTGCKYNTSGFNATVPGSNPPIPVFCPTGGNVPAQCTGTVTTYGCTKGACTANAGGADYNNAQCNSNCNLSCTVAPIPELGSTNKSGSMTYYDPNIANCGQTQGLTVPSADLGKVNLANNPARFRVTCKTEENDQLNVKHRIYITPSSPTPGVTFSNPVLSLAPTAINGRELTTIADFIATFPDGLDMQNVSLNFKVDEYITDLAGVNFNNGTFPRTTIATQIQQVDTRPPVLSRTSDFKLSTGSCIGTNCTDPNKIIGSGKLQIDYKAQDASGLLQRTVFAGSANWNAKTQYFNELDSDKNPLRQNLAQSFDYYHNNPALNNPISTTPFKIDQVTGISTKDTFVTNQNLQQNNALDTISIVYNLKSPEEPITKPFSFNWGLGGTGANDLNSTWQATDNFCNRISGNQTSQLSLGNPWLSVVGGSSFVQGNLDMTIPQNIINANATEANKLTRTGYFASYLTRTESDQLNLSGTLAENSKYNQNTTNINGESLLNPYKISHGRSASMYDYYQNIVGTVNRYDENSEIYCSENSQRYFKITNPGAGLTVTNSLTELNNSVDANDSPNILSCNKPAQVYEINGDLKIQNNLAAITYNTPTIIFVSGNLTIDASLVSANNSSLLFVVKGDTTILGGIYSSNGLTPAQAPGYDKVQASFIVDGVFLSLPDDGQVHDYFGNHVQVALPAQAQLWDGLDISGSVLLTGLCPNDMPGHIPTYDQDGNLTSAVTRADGNDNCESKFGRDLILVQNFLYPAERVTYNAQTLLDFRYLLRSTPKFKLIETGYDPTR